MLRWAGSIPVITPIFVLPAPVALRRPGAVPACAPTCTALLHAGTGLTRLTASGPEVVRIKLRDDSGVSIGELEVDVDPHGADFAHTGALTPMKKQEPRSPLLLQAIRPGVPCASEPHRGLWEFPAFPSLNSPHPISLCVPLNDFTKGFSLRMLWVPKQGKGNLPCAAADVGKAC